MKLVSADLVKPVRSWLLVVVLILSGLLFSLWLFLFLKERDTALQQQEFISLADQRMQALEHHHTRSLEALFGLAAFLGETHNRDWTLFQKYTNGSLQRLPELQALEWIPNVKGKNRQAFEQTAREQGLSNFRITEFNEHGSLRSASTRDEYYPVFYAWPANVNVEAIGLDLASQPDRLKAIRKSLLTGEIAATAPVRLAQEKVEEVYGVLIFAPVYRDNIASNPIDGFALAVYRTVDLLGNVFSDMHRNGIYVSVVDSEREHLLLYASDKKISAASLATSLEVQRNFNFGHRSWRVQFKPTRQYINQQQRSSVYVYPLLSALLSIIFGFHAGTRNRYILEVENEVKIRTRALTEEVQNRREAEAAAHKAEKMYRSMFENSIDGIFQSTKEGRYLSANTALARIYGYASREDFLNEVQDIEKQLYVDPQRRKDFVDIMHRDGKVEDFVSEVFRRDGSRIYILEKAISVYADNGEFLYYEGNVQDITNRIQAELALQKTNEWLEESVQRRTSELAKTNQELQDEVRIRKTAEQQAASANAAKTQFLASMSHEIRTPLNAIIGYSQILQQQEDIKQHHSLAVKTISQSGSHLLALVDDIMELSKIESGHISIQHEPFDLASLVTNMAYIVRKRCDEKGLKLRVEGLGNKPFWVLGDEIKLRQILINLLSNAIKYTFKGEVLLRVIPEDNERYRFEVIDTGPGIPQQEVAKVFDQFYQRSTWKEGTGLGLSISSRLARALGTELQLRSQPEMGCNFFFHLILKSCEPQFASLNEMADEDMRLAKGQKCLAMIVDDVQPNRDILQKMLEAMGCDVLSVENGQQALEYLTLQKPDIIFMDILMPGMDGIETRRNIRRRWPKLAIPIVAFSASAYEEQKKQYLNEGFEDVIAKPFRLEQLHYCLQKQLNLKFEILEKHDKIQQQDIAAISIPHALATPLLNSARIYNVTRLKEALSTLALSSDEHKILASYLRQLMEAHKFKELIHIVEMQTDMQNPASAEEK